MEISELTAIPLVLAMVQLVKKLDFIPEKWYPVISLFFGVIVAFLLPEPWDPRASIIKGILFGLSASGLYSGSKKMVE